VNYVSIELLQKIKEMEKREGEKKREPDLCPKPCSSYSKSPLALVPPRSPVVEELMPFQRYYSFCRLVSAQILAPTGKKKTNLGNYQVQGAMPDSSFKKSQFTLKTS
jgi:hypothetical protein